MSTQTFQHPVTLGRIDYMNVAPVYYGIDNSLLPMHRIHVISGPPSTLNQMMSDGRLDISPVSAAAYAKNAREWMILPDLAIACHQRVLSVLLVSRYSLEALSGKRILITDESASARDLCRLIFSLKGIRPEFIVGKVKRLSQLPKDIDAALVIGDSALSQRWERVFPHIHDLGTLWWHMTGLPFVFAVWAVRKEFARKHPERVAAVLALLKASRDLGYKNMGSIVEKACARLGIDVSTARLYYKSLVYHLADHEIQGLEMFCKGLYQAGITADAAPIYFFGNDNPKTGMPASLPYADSPVRSISRGIAGCCPAG